MTLDVENTIDLSALQPELDMLRMAALQIKTWEQVRDRARAMIEDTMGEYEAGVIGDVVVVTWKATRPSARFNSKALKEKYKQIYADPDLWTDYTTRPFKVVT